MAIVIFNYPYMVNIPMVEAEKVTIEERSSKENAGKTVIINPMIVLDGNAFGVAVINKVS